MNTEEQQFLSHLDKQLWAAADRLRAAVNPSEYMHVVLGLVYLGDVPLLKPVEPLVHAFEVIAGSLRNQQIASSVESDSLGAVRDAWQPKLLTGELRSQHCWYAPTRYIADNVMAFVPNTPIPAAVATG
ncbi:MAG TPA: type I restriction-modification system subunit M N-terminal domain-containing protein [Rhodoferax sp.]